MKPITSLMKRTLTLATCCSLAGLANGGAWEQAQALARRHGQRIGPQGGSIYTVDPMHADRIHDAYWIWSDRDTNAIPPKDRAARHTFTRRVTLDGPVEHALIEMTVQGAYTLWVNDHEVGGNDQWHRLSAYDLAPYLEAGENRLRVEAVSDFWMSGLFAVGTVRIAGHESVVLDTCADWEVFTALDPTPRRAEPVVRGMNGGFWNNVGRVQIMPSSFYRMGADRRAPGIGWGRNMPAPAPRVLAILGRSQQPDLIEWTHRLDMDLTVVFSSFEPTEQRAPFFPNVFGERHEEVAAALREALDDRYDLVILGAVDAALFTEVVSDRLLAMLDDGTGLVCDVLPPSLRDTLKDAAIPEDDWPASLTGGIPFARLPGFQSQEGDTPASRRVLSLYRYGRGRIANVRLVPRRHASTSLLADVQDPVELHYEYYTAFVLRSLLWAAGREPGVTVDLPLEQTVAADRDPAVRFTLDGTEDYAVTLSIRSPDILHRAPAAPDAAPDLEAFAKVLDPVFSSRIEVRGGTETVVPLPPLPAGGYFVDLQVDKLLDLRHEAAERVRERIAWAAAHLTVTAPVSLGTMTLDPPVIDVSGGGSARLAARVAIKGAPSPDAFLRFQLIDNHQRVIDTQTGTCDGTETTVTFDLTRFDTLLGRVRVELHDGSVVRDIGVAPFTAIRRDWDRFFFVIYGASQPSERRNNRLWWRTFASLGVDAMRYRIPDHRDLEVIDVLGVPLSGGYTRGDVTMSPESMERVRDIARQAAEQAVPFDPLAYTMDDEITYGGGDLAPGRREHFRATLRERYGTIEALNAQWDAAYTSFDDILPFARGPVPEDIEDRVATQAAVLEQARQTRNYSRIVDQWEANIDAWYTYPRLSREAIQAVDPHARVGTGCPMWPHAASGHDWHRNLRIDGFEQFAPYGRDGEILPLEEARSFAAPDTFLGLYYGGYLYNGFVRREQQTDLEWQRWRVWSGLLRGFTSIWWYEGGVVSREGALGGGFVPYDSFHTLADEIRDIRNGFFPLFDRNQAARDYGPIAVHYSIASRLVAPHLAFGGGEYAHNWNAHYLHRILADHLGHTYTFVSEADLRDNSAMQRFRVLILPLSLAVGDEELAAIRAFAESGGLVIADARAAIADARGRVRSREAATALTGLNYAPEAIDRRMLTARLAGTYEGVTIDTPEQCFPADPAVRLAGAEPLWEVDGLPLMTHHAVGEGHVISFNIPFNYYQGYPTPDHMYYYVGETGHNRLMAELLHAVLAGHGIERPVGVSLPDAADLQALDPAYRTDHWLPGLEVPYHVDGAAQYVSLTKRRIHRHEGEHTVILRPPRGGHWYDSRAGRALGEHEIWTTPVRPGDAQVFAVLPYAVEAIDLDGLPGHAQAGDTLRLRARLNIGGAEPQRHVLRLDVLRPDGIPVGYLRQVVQTRTGEAVFELPFARNDIVGEWTLRVTDVATGVQTEATVALVQGE